MQQACMCAAQQSAPTCHCIGVLCCCRRYTDRWNEQQWLQAWGVVAWRFAKQPAVIGMGLRNEPRPTTVGGWPTPRPPASDGLPGCLTVGRDSACSPAGAGQIASVHDCVSTAL
jgi:hypothetical protein